MEKLMSDTKEVVLQGRSIMLAYHQEGNFLEMHFSGPSSSEEYREAWDKALELAIQHQVKHWFFNQQKMSIHPEDLKWATEDWYPRSQMALGDDRYLSIVVSENFFSEFQLKKNIETLNENGKITQTEYFKTKEEALAWLKSKF